MDLLDIIKTYLSENEFDGLYNNDCGCKLDDLISCGNIHSNCIAGHFQELHKDDKEFDFRIGPKNCGTENKKITTKNIVESYLIANNFHGIYAVDDDCCCDLKYDGVMCCSEVFNECKPGYYQNDATGIYSYKIDNTNDHK